MGKRIQKGRMGKAWSDLVRRTEGLPESGRVSASSPYFVATTIHPTATDTYKQ